jgi:hypothetical protein
MSIHRSLPLLAAHFVLLGMIAANVARAESAAPPASRFEAEAGPVDASIATQPPAHAKRGVKASAARKSAIARSPLISNIHRQVSTPNGKIRVVRNAIGQQLRPAADIKAINSPAREQGGNDIAAKANSPMPNAGSDAVSTGTRRELFVPLQASATAPRDPRMNTTMNRLIISGRDMVRPGFGAGMIGGAAKSNSGVIAGSDFRSRHSASQ